MTDLATINELFPPRAETTQRETNSVEDLGSDAFLQLMVAQMENQDPTNPMDNTDFVAQLAQFGSVSGIQELNESFASLSASLTAGQSWQAASLVGRSVVTESNLGQLREVISADGESSFSLEATVDFDGNATGGNFYVQDLNGRLVYSSALPGGVQGELQVQWDGLDNDGKPVPPGSYRVSADVNIGGQSTTIAVYAHQRVDSVAIDSTSGDITLNLSGGGDLAINQVKQFL